MELDETTLYRHIGDAIRDRRHDRGWTQGQVAEAAGVLRTSVANVEAGRQRAPLHLIYRICAALNLEVGRVLPRVAQVAGTPNIPVELGQTVVDLPPKGAEFLRELWEAQSEDDK